MNFIVTDNAEKLKNFIIISIEFNKMEIISFLKAVLVKQMRRVESRLECIEEKIALKNWRE